MQLLGHLPERHLDQLCELYQAEWWTRGRRRPEVERMLAGSTEVVAAVADVNGEQRLLGFARALSDGAFRAIVFDMIVAPAHRGRGVGRVVLEELLARPSLARSAGVELMCLPEMAAYYERFGFRPGDPGVIRMQRPRS
jgi:GNAT superfamily N-acetyltransferase